MLTVILPRWADPKVIHLTQENLQKELSSVTGAELLLTDGWGEGISKCRTPYVCLVEPDCLVNSGYFASLMGLFKKNHYFRRLAMMSSGVGINNWANKIYGYNLGENYADGVLPVNEPTSTKPYMIQIGYVPGAVLRHSILSKLKVNPAWEKDLVYFSTMVSLELWRKGYAIEVNPSTTYVTTEDYVGRQGKFDPKASDLVGKLTKATDHVFL